MIYLDNAASTWPKPKEVSRAMVEAVENYAANPGRGGHRLAQKASQVVNETRRNLAALFHVQDSNSIVFQTNATAAINQALFGLQWKEGDHVISTSLEHNSVRRPLEKLKDAYGVQTTYLDLKPNEEIKPDDICPYITEHTKLIACTHMSNLTGQVMPVSLLGQLADEHNLLFLVDASQSAGYLPIDVEELKIDLLAFPGHKGLYGPQGTGGLYVSPRVTLTPLLHGGTGRFSEDVNMPGQMPERLEAGTLNTPGIAGLGEGVRFILNEGIDKIQQHEAGLTTYALRQLNDMSGIAVYGPTVDVPRGPVIAFNIKGVHSHEVAHILNDYYGVAVRAGMHCTPLAHHAHGTERTGALRISFSYFNRTEEVDHFIDALMEIKEGLLGE
ncbi:aminotransferase class V-fold PLP-dependent enzyme [Caldalkalibacillus salinus]|uniref:aminotransferase class V-fold PLP-dependent enzyme n=1 Tax=Caldalkalibacillus salinus TaxID=2803787 RepID=UPI00192387BD|nr:aminotransferase class V-fold PLP-dependent enzyme [Caldalkalibacillus salinus]